MKKSRVIIPALAMIAFSVAASITGAVAWFTASRTASIDAGTYTVVKTSAELEYKLTRGAGTTVNQAGDTVSVSGVLTDGSLDHDSSIIYTPAADGRSLLPAENAKRAIALTEEVSGETQYKAYSDYESLLERGSTVARQDNPSKTIYTAVTFELEFTVTFGEVAGDIGLFLDNTEELVNNVLVKKSHFEVDGTPKTAKGFRMAFLPHEAAGNARVFADLQDEKVDENTLIKHIGGSNPDSSFSAGGSAYGTNEVIDKNYKAALPTASTARATALARPDCLGVFTFTASSRVTLSYTVVAWFEGTDPEIVNRATADEYQSVGAYLSFEGVDLAAA